eukprot:CAMPEP_0202894264 /NCGR_PEP_ID=MMETSP1392-20130828/3703_1 /ASSEMBLY_ACC=CAM_ASM_000868 /TAXON_ID=225041 /ORGANISM="Chlamydomonas chlamydogama, Strain SAG 11-48b" /LENGTH=119 /DNA_ID=CAMNT_0049578909 /DNA_START=418 /DNA_END=778 /DNA_ORIENTATION=+
MPRTDHLTSNSTQEQACQLMLSAVLVLIFILLIRLHLLKLLKAPYRDGAPVSAVAGDSWAFPAFVMTGGAGAIAGGGVAACCCVVVADAAGGAPAACVTAVAAMMFGASSYSSFSSELW